MILSDRSHRALGWIQFDPPRGFTNAESANTELWTALSRKGNLRAALYW